MNPKAPTVHPAGSPPNHSPPAPTRVTGREAAKASRDAATVPELVTAFAVFAGSVDLWTGVLLVFAPVLTLRLMMIPDPVAPTVLLRWVGVFVGSLGASYLLALATPAERRRFALATTFRFTALVRVAVACFVTWAMSSGSLSWQWTSVAVTDFALAAFQLWLLRRL